MVILQRPHSNSWDVEEDWEVEEEVSIEPAEIDLSMISRFGSDFKF